jgi:hypothetical protein
VNYRAALIKFFTFLGGVYFFLEFVLPADINGFKFGAYNDQITNAFIVVGTMAVGLGLINLLRVHGAKVIFLRRGWVNSVALLFGLVLMLFVTGRDWLATLGISRQAQQLGTLADFAARIASDHQSAGGDPAARLRILAAAVESRLSALADDLNGRGARTPEAADLTAGVQRVRKLAADIPVQSGAAVDPGLEQLAVELRGVAALEREVLYQQYEGSPTKALYSFFYQGLFVPLGSAMFALLGFFIATAAYRAFRVRSWESGLMMGAAILVMLGQIPFGIWLWKGMPGVRLWLLAVPNSAAFRAITIGAAIASLVMAFRMWLSIESETFSRDK